MIYTNNNTSQALLDQEKTPSKEKKVPEDSPPSKKRNLYFFDLDLRKRFDLSPLEAIFFNTIENLQCVNDGFCRAKNFYFIDVLGISDNWIRNTLNKLQKLGLLWYHVYNTKQGKRRHVVTRDSIKRYQKYLESHESWNLLRKFREEFSFVEGITPPSCLKTESQKKVKKQQPKKSEVQIQKKHIKSNKTNPVKKTQASDLKKDLPKHQKKPVSSPPYSDFAKRPGSGCYKYKYLYNNKNDDIRKASSEPPRSFVVPSSFEELKKDLAKNLSEDDIKLGITWLLTKSREKREGMKNVSACIFHAVKKGYALEDIATHEEKQKLEKQKVEHKKTLEEKERNKQLRNKQFANHLVKNFSHLKGWKHHITSERMMIYNEGLEETKDPNTPGCSAFRLPGGGMIYGKPCAGIDFKGSLEENQNSIQKAFHSWNWMGAKDKEENLSGNHRNIRTPNSLETSREERREELRCSEKREIPDSTIRKNSHERLRFPLQCDKSNIPVSYAHTEKLFEIKGIRTPP